MYKDEIKKYSPLTIEDIIKTCQELVPSNYRRAPWTHPEVDHGRGVLQSEDGLNCYLAGYGEAHALKAFKAIKMLPVSAFNEPFEIFDWGCGQGVGSICLIQSLKEKGLVNNLKQITLVEPSTVALQRAQLNISHVEPNVKVIPINKGLPASCPLPFECVSEINVKQPTVIHFFSNILDIGTINLKALSELISSKGDKHYVICVGPADCQEDRINAFCSNFSEKAATFMPPFRET